MATENLKVKITADAQQAKAEIGKFKDSLKGAIQEGETAVKSISKVTVALGAMMAAVQGVKAAVKNAVDVAAAGDAIKDNAQKVFMGTTAYQEWGYVLEQNGIEISALKTSMRKFSTEVASGSDSLRKYGITATDVDTAFSQAIYTIQNMSTETEKIAAATEMFGNRALELFPILNLTNTETQNLMATYRAIGGTMSNELIAASDVCTDSITEMRAAWGGLRNLLAAYVIPIITKVVKWITLAIAYIRILLAAILGIKETFGGKSGSSKKSLAGTSGSVAKNTGGTAKNLKKAARHAKELRKTLMGIDELTKLAEKATSSAASGGGGGGGGGGVSVGGGLGDLGDATELFSDDTLSRIEKFREKVELVADKLHGLYLIGKGMTEILLFHDWDKGIADVKEGLLLLFPKLADLKDEFDGLKLIGKGVMQILTGDWSGGVTTIREGIGKLLPDMSNLKLKWEELKKKIIEKIETTFGIKIPTWSDIKKKYEELKNNLVKKIEANFGITLPTWSSLKKKWTELKGKFTGKSVGISISIPSWSSLKKKWNDLTKNFKDKKASIKLTFKNALSSAWNTLANKVNAARSKSKLVKSLLPAFPKLAKGGILTAPTAAVLGEYAGAKSNPEIATPQSLMYETIKSANGDLVSAFTVMTRQVIAAIEDKDLSVSIGDEQIARSAQRGNTAYRNRTGKALLTI